MRPWLSSARSALRFGDLELALGHRAEDFHTARDDFDRVVVQALERKPRVSFLTARAPSSVRARANAAGARCP